MIADMEANTKLGLIVTELFIRDRKRNISLIFTSCFKVPKDIRINATHYFIMKIPYKKELQKIASNHLPDTSLKNS